MRFLPYALFAACCTLYSADFSQKLLSEVRQCAQQKNDVLDILDKLAEQGEIIEQGSDDLRVKFVNAQGAIEHVLACQLAMGEIEGLTGAIHTPNPATPLCVKPEGTISDLLDASIRNDPRKLYTVRSRAQIVRDFLAKGGTLYIAYPKGGLEKRSPEQQAIYQEELELHPGRLVDWVLASDQIAPDLIGATYLFRSQGELYAFSIQSRQANDIQKEAQWGLWFGPLSDAKIQARVDAVFNALSEIGGPDLRQLLAANGRRLDAAEAPAQTEAKGPAAQIRAVVR